MMKKLLTSLLICSFYAASAQTNCTLKILNLNDSTSISGAFVEVTFISQNAKRLKSISDNDGNSSLILPTNAAFDLLVFKEGYKPISAPFASASSTIIIYLKPLIYDGEEVTVLATRASNNHMATFTQLTKKEISQRNFGQDLPILLQNTPSAVTTSDAGAGIGYTGIRIRGIDPTRINVTINGVPLNDAESQGVFWVNMPDFSSGIDNIQVQRGAGTSTNGAGAFGASINIKTDKFSELPFTKISLSQGSFNTSRQSVKFGTGKMAYNWYAEGRMAWIKSDGFINRAASNLQSWYFTTGHKTSKSLFQVNVFSGSEKTSQAWNGNPMVKYKNDSLGVDSFIVWQYLDSAKTTQLRNSNNYKYNSVTYPNETDNYKQSHVQIVYNRNIRKNQTFNIVLHGTLGKGYYENFLTKTNLSNFTDTPVVFYGNNYYNANLIHQQWLDNNFAGVVFSYTVNKAKTDQTFGGAANRYYGKHYGTVIWHEFMNADNKSFDYYNNHANKSDINFYWKVQHRFSRKLSAFTDLQYRHINYSWFGPSASGIVTSFPAQQNITYNFFNPKAGIQYQRKNNELIYLTYGRASREPIRDDFVNSNLQSRPRPEFMNNIETAYKSSLGDWKFSITGYYIGYKNQLALSGKLNNVGGYTRINIPKSYRTGIEFETNVDIATWINWSINFTFSQNKIKEFTEYVDDWTNGGQVAYVWKNTDLALSPNKIVGSQISIKATKTLSILYLTKYVGRQYLDNTQTNSRSLDPYLVNDLIFQYQPKIKNLNQCSLGLMINNIGNNVYTSNGYTYSGMINNNRRDFSFVYPQAGTNFLVRLEFLF